MKLPFEDVGTDLNSGVEVYNLGVRAQTGWLRLGLRIRSDYSACHSPRTIDSSTEWGYSAVRDQVMIKVRVTKSGYSPTAQAAAKST
eukprot:1391743-Amorphochlora_amoeboformis.AAC.1